MKPIIGNERGTALVTALSLGLIASVFVAALWVMTRMEVTTVSDVDAYNRERKTAQGVAELVMVHLKDLGTTCSGTPCSDKTGCSASSPCSIDLPPTLCTSLGKTDCSTISANYLGISELIEGPQTDLMGSQIFKTTTLQSITITSENENSINTSAPQMAIIDIVYKRENTPAGWIE